VDGVAVFERGQLEGGAGSGRGGAAMVAVVEAEILQAEGGRAAAVTGGEEVAAFEGFGHDGSPTPWGTLGVKSCWDWVWEDEGIPQGLKPVGRTGDEKAKPEGLAYLEDEGPRRKLGVIRG
jgi:hypothetical protein